MESPARHLRDILARFRRSHENFLSVHGSRPDCFDGSLAGCCYCAVAQLSHTGNSAFARRKARPFRAHTPDGGRQAGPLRHLERRGPDYRFNIAQDLKPEDIQPWAEELFLQRVRDSRKDSPLARCLPVSVPFHNFFNLTRIVQTPALMVILYESPNSPHRTVFTDGRDLPKDSQSDLAGVFGRAMGGGHARRDYCGF